MNKKSISLLLAITLLTGVTGNATTKVFADTLDTKTIESKTISVEELYKNAYNATISATKIRTQESVTIARYEIWKLPKEYESALGTFSSLLDDVQLELFRTFLAIFHVNGVQVKSLSQADINKGREMLEGFYTWENNKQYCYTWSNCMDNYQVNIMKEVESALRKAQSSKAKSDIDKARQLMDVIITVKYNDGVLNWANTLNKELITLENSIVEPPIEDKDYVVPPTVSGLNTKLRERYMQEYFYEGLYFYRNGKMINTFDEICNDLASGKLSESQARNKIETLRWEEDFAGVNGIYKCTIPEISYQYDKTNNAYDIYNASIDGAEGEYKAISVYYDKEKKQNKIVIIAINLSCQPF